MGGELILEADAACEVMLGGVIVGMSSRAGSAQPPDAEYPHIGLNVEPDQFLPMVCWLEDHGVKTHAPWTRNGRTALMFFKDP